MGKLISQIQNYPLSAGSVAYSNQLLLDDNFAIQQNKLKDYFKFLFEISKNINFFNEMGTSSDTWNDLLKQDTLFQFARFLTIATEDLQHFFKELAQTNGFKSDDEINQDEYEILCYQRLQIIQYLFLYYKTIAETINDNSNPQVTAILKNDKLSRIFVQYKALSDECLSKIITNNHDTRVADFNEIVFELIDVNITNSLQAYYNPLNDIGNQVLDVYIDYGDKIKAANEYAYSIFKSLLQIHQTFTFWATTKLAELITTATDHSPHSALIIAFSKLKMLYDVRYNQLIHQHSAFIYNDILKLKKQPAFPDNAYVSIELAKNVNQYFLETSTLFKAGKNSKNKTVYYKGIQDIVLNSAKIANLKSCVRISPNGSLSAVRAVDNADDKQWQVNDAWLPFNDIIEANTGIGFESKLLESINKKDTAILFRFIFANKNVPEIEAFKDKFEVKIVLENDTEESLRIDKISKEENILTISAVVVKDLSKTVKNGINARLKLVSPYKEKDSDGFVVMYKYLLSEPIRKVEVELTMQQFVPDSVRTAAARFGGSESFIAFGAQSLAGSSFHIDHPFFKYANIIDELKITWSENLKEDLTALITDTKNTVYNSFKDHIETTAENVVIDEYGITIKLKADLTYVKQSISGKPKTTLPIILQVKSINLSAKLTEIIYENENAETSKYIEVINRKLYLKPLRSPFIQKALQRTAIIENYKRYLGARIKKYYHNAITHLYPLGELRLNTSVVPSFLPDYKINGYAGYVADLYIGLTGILPGQTISLLFDIADETAMQSKLEAKISWHYVSENNFIALDASKVIDTTANFLQTGIVQLSLPEDATNNNTIIEGKDTFWIIARCNDNYEVVANIRNIKTNAISVLRVLDENNDETKISVAPNTIEKIFPNTANIKSIEQSTPSQNGREIENDKHFFDRSSQLLRHKERAINQWDFEQIVLEKFSSIYKVKCLNHAYYDEESTQIIAKATNTIIALLPHYRVNVQSANFQPAIPVSKLVEIRSLLKNKTSPFNQLQVINTNWDTVKIDLTVMLNKGVLDIPFYQQKLDEDIKKLLAPWAFDKNTNSSFGNQKIYSSTIIDFIDELPYVHHIRQFQMYKNDEVQHDEIIPTSEIHLLTSAAEHIINVVEYAD